LCVLCVCFVCALCVLCVCFVCALCVLCALCALCALCFVLCVCFVRSAVLCLCAFCGVACLCACCTLTPLYESSSPRQLSLPTFSRMPTLDANSHVLNLFRSHAILSGFYCFVIVVGRVCCVSAVSCSVQLFLQRCALRSCC
jgi:hypothetical protein